MNNCKNIQEQIVDYLNGHLEEEEVEIIRNHCKECRSCAEELKIQKDFFNTLDSITDEIPSPKLQHDFDQMLEEEMEKINPSSKKISKVVELSVFMKYAAIVLFIFCSGFILGKLNTNQGNQKLQIAELQNKLSTMQQNLTLAALEQPTSSERLKAVNLIEEQNFANTKVIETLIQCLQSDASVNVRMAAANALTRFPNHPMVKNALLNALSKQKDTAMQMTLINIIIQLKDQRAIEILKSLIDEKNNLPVVKDLAREGIQVLV